MLYFAIRKIGVQFLIKLERVHLAIISNIFEWLAPPPQSSPSGLTRGSIPLVQALLDSRVRPTTVAV